MQSPQEAAADRQRRQDELYDRNMAQWRSYRAEQVRREFQEQQAYQAMTRSLQQAQASQEWQDYRDQEANRRRAMEREAQQRSLAELRSQQEATALFLELQRRQLQQPAAYLQR
jgi:hypothetical protein